MLLFFLSLGSYLFYIILKYRKSIYMLQQNSYNTSNRYIKWVFKNYDKTLITEDFLFLIIYFLYYVIEFNFFAILIFVFYLGLFYLELKKVKLEQNKKPFVITSRVKRLIFTLVILFLLYTIYIVLNFDINMVNYYLIHKNADDSVVSYIKNKLNNTNIEDLIIIQIELLYTDPSDKLVSGLLNYINNRVNEILKNISLYELTNLISSLKDKVKSLENEINKLEIKNKEIFEMIKTKDLNNDNKFDNEDSVIASNLINDTQNNEFLINRKKSEINSLGIWLNNLEKSFDKKENTIDLEELLNSYIEQLSIINRDEYINKYIFKTYNKIDAILLNSNLLDTIVNIIPELDRLYNNNSSNKNELYKLLDYYIDLVDLNVKQRINKLDYEEKILLKEKINLIIYDILNNSNPDDDFKVLIINNYIKYL